MFIITSYLFKRVFYRNILLYRLCHSVKDKVFKKVTHCIFDLDGTLINSEDFYHTLIRQTLENEGYHYTEELERELRGRTTKDVFIRIVDHFKIQTSHEKLDEKFRKVYMKHLPYAPFLPGVLRLLNHLANHDIPMALATNSTKGSVDVVSKAHPRVFGVFHHKVTASDPELTNGKPDPLIYLIAARRFDEPRPKPKDCLVFEDSVAGMTAGIAAGMQVVVMTNNRNKEDFERATLVIPSLLTFKPELFGLPEFIRNEQSG